MELVPVLQRVVAGSRFWAQAPPEAWLPVGEFGDLLWNLYNRATVSTGGDS